MNNQAETQAVNDQRTYLWLTGIIALTDLLLAVVISVINHITSFPGGWLYTVTVVLGLTAYAIIIATIATRTPLNQVVYQIALKVGLISAGLWTINLLVEIFARLHGLISIIISAPLLLCGFAAWAIGAAYLYRSVKQKAAIFTATLLGAMLCVLITLLTGFIFCLTSLPRLAVIIDGSPEFIESGWHNTIAFAAANTLDAARTHLLVAPIVSLLIAACVVIGLNQKTTKNVTEPSSKLAD